MRTAPIAVRLAFAAAAAVLAGCSTLDVRQDWDPAADFSNWHTYAWREPAGEGGGLTRDPLLAKRVRAAVDDELAARGFAPAATGADFTVGWCATVQQRVSVDTIDDYWGYWRRPYVPRWRSSWVTTYEEGTLVVDVADGATGEAVWRGSATDIVDPAATPEEREARVREAVRAILAKFPPPR